MTEKRLTLSFVGQTFHELGYFYHFFFIPTIATFSENVYGLQRKWLYQRVFAIYFLWWEVSINWKYGRANND